jgi:hypothetical protein
MNITTGRHHFIPPGAQAAALRAQHRQLLVSLRPEAVGLVDAFGWEDYALNSALGRSDGDVYKALLDMATVSTHGHSSSKPGTADVLLLVVHWAGGWAALSVVVVVVMVVCWGLLCELAGSHVR